MKELLEKRAAALATVQRLRDVMDNESRDLNDGEQKEFDAACEEYDAVNAQIERHQRAAQMEANQQNSTPVPGRDSRTSDGRIDTRRASVLSVNAFMRRSIGMELTDEQRQALEQTNFSYGRDGFDLRMLHTPPRTVREARAQSAIIGEDGGFTVPQGFMNNIEVALLQYAAMRQFSEVIRTDSGNEIPWPTSDDTSNEGTWLGENEDNSGGTNVKFGSQAFRAHKISSKVILIPYELFEDSAFDILTFISQAAGERIGRGMARAYTTGNGVKKPTGWVTTAEVGKTTAATNAITFDEIIELEHSVDPAYRIMDTVGYQMHDNIKKSIRKLKDNDGQYLWVPSRVAGEPDTLHGFPVITNQNMDSALAASNKVMGFGDWSKYKIRDVRSARVKVLTERYAENDQIGVLVIMRTDGHLLDAGTNPVKSLQMAAS